MKATIKDMMGTIIATARKKETKTGFPDLRIPIDSIAIGALKLKSENYALLTPFSY